VCAVDIDRSFGFEAITDSIEDAPLVNQGYKMQEVSRPIHKPLYLH
jgi:hypothetical protein